ncbi:MAG: hypothetical protein H6884_03930, partial [Rhodobiaceae bacterium]|nr:hypothetical protein [Rhodobiaceae bacterium]
MVTKRQAPTTRILALARLGKRGDLAALHPRPRFFDGQTESPGQHLRVDDNDAVILICLSSSCGCRFGKGDIGERGSVQIGDELTLRLSKPGFQAATSLDRTVSAIRPETLDERLSLFEQ